MFIILATNIKQIVYIKKMWQFPDQLFTIPTVPRMEHWWQTVPARKIQNISYRSYYSSIRQCIRNGEYSCCNWTNTYQRITSCSVWTLKGGNEYGWHEFRHYDNRYSTCKKCILMQNNLLRKLLHIAYRTCSDASLQNYLHKE